MSETHWGDSGLPNRSPPFDDALPMLGEPLLVRGHRLAQHFADSDRHLRHRILMRGVVVVRALIVAPLEEVERDADEQRAGRLHPKGIRARRLLIQHRRDALHIIDAQMRILGDIRKGIPARRAAVGGEWIERGRLR